MPERSLEESKEDPDEELCDMELEDMNEPNLETLVSDRVFMTGKKVP